MIEDELDKETFICMDCGKECSVTEGAWPQRYIDTGEWNLDADTNNRERFEFVCYDCIGE